MTSVDYIGLAQELATQSEHVQSQSAQRAMKAAARGLMLMGTEQLCVARITPRAQPLSDPQIDAIRRKLFARSDGWDGDGWDVAFTREVEAAHGIGPTTPTKD